MDSQLWDRGYTELRKIIDERLLNNTYLRKSQHSSPSWCPAMDLKDGIAEVHRSTQETQKVRLDNNVQNHTPSLKLTVLATLVLLNVTGNLSTRYARIRPGDMFAASSAVVTAELIKLCACLALVYCTECSSWKRFLSLLNDRIAKRPADTLNVCVPSLVYLLHNNLEYVAVSNLDVATYQVISQSKILATAVCSVLVLKRALRTPQWIALAVLVLGIVFVQLDAGETSSASARPPHRDQNRVTGLASAVAGSCLSGFAGVHLEKILKGDTEVSLWLRNVQLSLVSLPMGLAVCLASNWDGIANRADFFFGYDYYVVYLICLKAAGGLVVSMAIKHADMLVKEFAASLAICITCVFAVYFFDFKINARFVAGAMLVMFSIIVHSYAKTKESPSPNVI